MRAWAGLLVCYVAAVMAVHAAEPLDSARSLAASGTPRLALDLIEKTQPADAGAPQWADWEALRCDVLTRLNRSKHLLERAERLPAGAAPPALHACLLPALRAATASGEGARAGHYAARLLWQGTVTAEELREIRLLVIESQLAAKRGEDAYRSMLRFDLDHRPLDRRTAARFVAALVDVGMAKEAVNWLGGLDDADPLKLMLRLEAGLVEPELAVKLARTATAKSPNAGWWEVVARAARMLGSRTLQIGALEQRLQLAPSGETLRAGSVQELWQAYLTSAAELAEQRHLLRNDDSGWGALAASRLNTDPVTARAMFAHLARRAMTAEARNEAQVQLESSLRSAKLDLVALRLFAHDEISVSALDPRLRYSLGGVAEARGIHAAVMRFWQGLPPPPGATAIDWHLRLATSMVRAAAVESSAALLAPAIGAAGPLTPENVKRVLALSQEMLDLGHPGSAEEVLGALAERVEGVERRRALFNLARASDASGKPLIAAGHYLRCAALAEAKAPDALAREARLAAGLSLARGGYREDARAQLEWVLKNSREQAQLDVARRELKKL